MRVVIYRLQKVKQRMLAEHLMHGFLNHGDDVSIYPGTLDFHRVSPNYELRDADLAVMIGGQSFEIYAKCAPLVPTLFVDKVYAGRRDYYRMVLDGHVPYYLNQLSDRFERLCASQIDIKPRVTEGKYVIYCGSSQTYCRYHKLGDALEYDWKICEQIQSITKTPLIYRMKSSLIPRDENKNYKVPALLPPGVIYHSPNEKLADWLPWCQALVTYGSNAATEAITAGVPAVVLSPEGINPVWSLANHSLEALNNLAWPTDEDRIRLLSKLAQVQFSIGEIESGHAWATIKPWMRSNHEHA